MGLVPVADHGQGTTGRRDTEGPEEVAPAQHLRDFLRDLRR